MTCSTTPRNGPPDPELAAVAHRPPHDPAHDVAATLVAGDHAVSCQEGGAARVVGHYSQGVVVGLVLAERGAR